VDSFTFAQIDYFNAVVAERTHKQSFACRIKREMVDPPFDAR
jgi:hypothetical protein